MTNKNITLVLSGGGARGIAHIGVIEEIERRGYRITSVAGTSMGALVGGIYAMGKLHEFKEWLENLDNREIVKLLDFTLSAQGLIKGDRILSGLKKFLSNAKIEDLPITYTATAFDLTNEREVVFTSGNLYDAIRASISIPTILAPVILGKSMLVDGGVVNNIPVKNAVRTENDLLVAVNVNAETPAASAADTAGENEIKRISGQTGQVRLISGRSGTKTKKINYFNLIDSTIASATNQLTRMILEKHPPEILIEIPRKAARTFDFLKARDLIETGRLAAKMKFDSITKADIPTNTSEMTTFFQFHS